MPVVKECDRPRGGGNPERCIRYIFGEEFTRDVPDNVIRHKYSDAPLTIAQRVNIDNLFAEAMKRPDLGVGIIWSPEAGGGKRPSSIKARGVTTLATAGMEFAAMAAACPDVEGPVDHLMYSYRNHPGNDELFINAAEFAMDDAGYTGHAALFSAHRDTKWVHVHVAVCTVNARTLRPYERLNNWPRLHRGARYAELNFDLPHERGAYVIRNGMVERVTKEERDNYRQERIEDRLDQLMVGAGFLSDNEGLESLGHRSDRLHYKIAQTLERWDDRDERYLKTGIHEEIHRLRTRFEESKDGKMILRLMERAEGGAVAQTWADAFGEQHERLAVAMPTDTIIEIDVKRVAPSPLDDYNSKRKPKPWMVAQDRKAQEKRAWLLGLGSVEEAEAEFVRVITEDPGRVARDRVNGKGHATFTADDIERDIRRHVTDDWAEHAERVLREDPALRIVGNDYDYATTKRYNGLDARSTIFTIESQDEKSRRLERNVREWLTKPDPLFDREKLDEAKHIVLAEKRETNPDFVFTTEQEQFIESLSRMGTVLLGVPGSGKTICNRVHKVYAELCGRDIRGFTTAQEAADKLTEETGIKSVNLARALVEDPTLLPANARFVWDEASMASIDAINVTIERSLKVGAGGNLQGGLDQLGNISAGKTFAIVARVAQEVNREELAEGKAITRFTEVFRQQGPSVAFMRKAVPKGSRAINLARKIAYAAYLRQYDVQGLVHDVGSRRAVVETIADRIVYHMRAGTRVIALGRSYEDCFYVSEHVRRALGLEGRGVVHEFKRGNLELSPGDRVLFRQNRRKMGVNNGDGGTVIVSHESRIDVLLDKSDEVVSFNPKRYKHIEYAYATTLHVAQGKGSPAVIYGITLQDDALSTQVGFTRTEQVLEIYVDRPWEEVISRLTKTLDRNADDARLFQAAVKRTGGPNSRWAKTIERARTHANDPNRKRYENVMAHRAEILEADIVSIINTPELGKREMDRQFREAVARNGPLSLDAWAVEEVDTLLEEFAQRDRQAKDLRLARATKHECTIKSPGAALVEQQRAEARALDEVIRQEKIARLDAADEARHARNVAVARASVVPLKGTKGEAYLRGRGITKFDDTMYAENWGAGFEVNDKKRDGSPKLSPGHGPAIVKEFFDPVTRESLGFQGRYLNPPALSDGNVLRQFNAGPAKRGVFATAGAWDSKTVAITEGFTDLLSLLSVEVEAFGCAGTGNIPDALPVAVAGRPVLIASDRDPKGAGDAMAEKLKAHLEPTGSTTTRLLVPWHDRTKKVDVNDALRSGELEASIDRALGIDPLLRESKKRYERSTKRSGIEFER